MTFIYKLFIQTRGASLLYVLKFEL